jgi:hypothetical protein
MFSMGTVAVASAAADASWNVLNQNQEHALMRAGMDYLAQASEVDSAWVAKARAEYPMSTCVVSGEPTSGSFDYVYMSHGQPYRLVRLASAQYVSVFLKDPAHYLALLDAAGNGQAQRSH